MSSSNSTGADYSVLYQTAPGHRTLSQCLCVCVLCTIATTSATLCLANCNRIRRLHLCSPSNNPISEIWLHSRQCTTTALSLSFSLPSQREWQQHEQQQLCPVPGKIGRHGASVHHHRAASSSCHSAVALHVSFACHSPWYWSWQCCCSSSRSS